MDQLLTDHKHTRRLVIGGLLLAIVLCSASQLCWKQATSQVPRGTAVLQTLRLTALEPMFWIAAALYVWQFFNWMRVLRYADLSFAQPIMAGTYVVVGAAAWLLFGESLPPHRFIGIGLILTGVVLISSSPHKSVAGPEKLARESAPATGVTS